MIDPDVVVTAVAKECLVTRASLFGRGRHTATVTLARGVAVYLVRLLCTVAGQARSWSELDTFFRVGSGTCLALYRRTALTADSNLKQLVERLRLRLTPTAELCGAICPWARQRACTKPLNHPGDIHDDGERNWSGPSMDPPYRGPHSLKIS